MATPALGTSAYLRTYDPVNGVAPTPARRIIQDIDRVFYSCRAIHEAKGAYVPDLANRSGHRKRERRSSNWGGKRERKIPNHWLLDAMAGDSGSVDDDDTKS